MDDRFCKYMKEALSDRVFAGSCLYMFEGGVLTDSQTRDIGFLFFVRLLR